jgi:uncharacterized protein involved in outer membrane biogenesis
LTKVDVKLDRVSLSLFSGAGQIKGLVVGNPEGFKTPHAISVGSASVALKPASLFSDKIVIKSIRVEAPDITFEGGFGGNNLGKILANVQSASSGGGGAGKTNAAAKTEELKPGRKLEVDEFIITGASVNLSLNGIGSQSVTVPLPDIHLSNLGTNPDGITAAELTRQVLAAIEHSAAQAAAISFSDLSKSANGLTKNLGKSVDGSVTNLTKGLGDLFKKK